MKNSHKILLAFTVLMVVWAYEAIAIERYVPSQYSTIQAAIDDCNNGDTVIVSPGTYTGDGNRDINFEGKAITVRSTKPNDPNIVAATVIDCQGPHSGLHRGFYFNSGEDETSTINGLTITNGYSYSHEERLWLGGGGITCYDSSPTIKNCVIHHNTSPLSGSGIYCYNSNAIITDCIISHNAAPMAEDFHGSGGGVYGCSSNLTISRCTISENIDEKGGGIYCYNSNAIITDCNISRNTTLMCYSAGFGGGVCGEGSSNLTISRCTISSNTGELGGGIFCDRTSKLTIVNSKIQKNTAVNRGNPTSGIGGGIYGHIALIRDCLITDNTSYSIGGAYLHGDEGADATIANCVVRRNTSERRVGGILFSGSGKIINCSITGNRAGEFGGGIECYGGYFKIINSSIIGNKGQDGGGVFIYDSNVAITDSILWNNMTTNGLDIKLMADPTLSMYVPTALTVSYSDIEGGQGAVGVNDGTCNWGQGNIDSDPEFVKAGFWDPNGTANDPNDDFWVDGDYRLGLFSPCVDTGDPNFIAEPNETDLAGNLRIIGGRVDMGAYESPELIEAKLMVMPKFLNQRSNGKFLIAMMQLPKNIKKNELDNTAKLVLYPGEIEAERQFVFAGRNMKNVKILAFFDREEFIDSVKQTGKVEVIVTGKLKTGQYFFGSDNVMIIKPTRNNKNK